MDLHWTPFASCCCCDDYSTVAIINRDDSVAPCSDVNPVSANDLQRETIEEEILKFVIHSSLDREFECENMKRFVLINFVIEHRLVILRFPFLSPPPPI